MPALRSAVAVALLALAGCQWDGPAVDVQVVPPSSSPGLPASDAATVVEAPTAGGGGSSAAGSASAVPGAATDVTPGPGALSMPRTVAVVGDSLTVSASEEIVSALTRLGVRHVVLDGRESRRMTAGSDDLPSGLSAIEQIVGDATAGTTPDLWVVALGTSDVGAQVGEDRFRGDLRATLAAIPRDAPVVWVDVWIRDRLDDVEVANATIRAEVSRRRSGGVVDWFAHGTDEALITDDGVHLTESGQVAFADAIAGELIRLSATR